MKSFEGRNLLIFIGGWEIYDQYLGSFYEVVWTSLSNILKLSTRNFLYFKKHKMMGGKFSGRVLQSKLGVKYRHAILKTRARSARMLLYLIGVHRLKSVISGDLGALNSKCSWVSKHTVVQYMICLFSYIDTLALPCPNCKCL